MAIATSGASVRVAKSANTAQTPHASMPTRAKYIAVRTMPFRKPATDEDLRVPAGQAVPTEGQLPPDSSAGEV